MIIDLCIAAAALIILIIAGYIGSIAIAKETMP